ncbi:MAG: protein-disulfide reductase DsbD domain-containing protein [Pseudomonadota bacterium]|nr:protein-disulfide reductase DsbD domain-containing protein [Pseudomonadota bacterium]
MKVLAVAISALVLPAVAAADTASGWAGIPEAEVRLIAGAGAPDGQPWLALEFAMAPGWKVYWRNPGDAGLPPVPDWSASTGVSIGEIAWPRPERIVSYGMETFVYHDHVVLPVRAERPAGDGPATVRLALTYGACEEVCVPVDATLELPLPAGPLTANRHGADIAAAMKSVPTAAPGILADAPRLGPDGSVTFTLAPARPVSDPEAIVEGPAEAVFSRPACVADGARLACVTRMSSRLPRESLVGRPMTITLYGRDGAAETTTRLSQ